MTLRIGTRGSQLALWQANEVARRLREAGVETELKIIKTTGDRRTDVSLATIGGKGLFIKEIEEALRAEEIDLAVHSLKDVPSLIDDDFALVAFLPRADARDAWIHVDGTPLANLDGRRRIGTSSPRRRAQLRALFPNVDPAEIRGNVDTRIAKARAGEFDGLVLAAAGLHRLERREVITSYFSIDEMTPAAGQGIVGMEILSRRDDVAEILSRINDDAAATSARIERGVLQDFGTVLDCYSSIGIHAVREGAMIHCHAFLSDNEGSRAIRFTQSAPAAEATSLVGSVAGELKSRGALDLLHSGAAR